MKDLRLKIKDLRLRILLVLLLTTFNFQLSTPRANAESISLGIDPPIIQLSTKHNTTVKEQFTISNFAETAVRVDISVRPFTAGISENGQVEYLPTQSPFVEDNVRVSDGVTFINSLILIPNEEKKLQLEIKIPTQEQSADHYFSVLFISNTTVSTTGEFSGHSITAGGIGMNVLLSIEGTEAPKAHIEEFSAPLFLEKGPVPFTVRIENEGNHVIAPSGTILIKNMFGQTIGQVILPETNILAHSTRALVDEKQLTEPEESSGFGAMSYESPKAIWYESFLVGPYVATLTLNVSGSGPVFTQTAYFFAMPLTGILGVVVAILVIFSIRSRVNKKLRS